MQSWLKYIPPRCRPSYVVVARAGIYEVAGLLFASLFFGYLLWEWLSTGMLAIPAKIAEYHFGSEAMVGEGGSHYASALAYAQAALRSAIFPTLPLVVLFGMAVLKHNAFYRFLAWTFLLSIILLNFLSN